MMSKYGVVIWRYGDINEGEPLLIQEREEIFDSFEEAVKRFESLVDDEELKSIKGGKFEALLTDEEKLEVLRVIWVNEG